MEGKFKHAGICMYQTISCTLNPAFVTDELVLKRTSIGPLVLCGGGFWLQNRPAGERRGRRFWTIHSTEEPFFYLYSGWCWFPSLGRSRSCKIPTLWEKLIWERRKISSNIDENKVARIYILGSPGRKKNSHNQIDKSNLLSNSKGSWNSIWTKS